MSRSLWGQTPRQSILAECERSGHASVLHACLDVLAGKEVEPALVRVLGGPHADRYRSFHAHGMALARPRPHFSRDRSKGLGLRRR